MPFGVLADAVQGNAAAPPRVGALSAQLARAIFHFQRSRVVVDLKPVEAAVQISAQKCQEAPPAVLPIPAVERWFVHALNLYAHHWHGVPTPQASVAAGLVPLATLPACSLVVLRDPIGANST
jgi:hypothetical protein